MPIINNRQTVLDLALQWLGDPERIIEVAMLNSMDVDDVAAGNSIAMPTVDLNQSTVINGLSSRKIVPASAVLVDNYADEWTLYYTTGLPESHG